MLIISFLIIYIVCGVITYSTHFAFYQREYPSLAERDYKRDRNDAMCAGLTGPIGLRGNATTIGFKHGLKFK